MLNDQYIWTQYLTADTSRLLVFQFSISTLSFSASFCSPNWGLLCNYILKSSVSAPYLHITYSWSNSIFHVHSTAHRLHWHHGLSIPFSQQNPPCSSVCWTTGPLQDTCTMIKLVLVKNKDSKIKPGSSVTFKSLGSRVTIASLFAVQSGICSKEHIHYPTVRTLIRYSG